ncbi:SseB family protein [Protaetiibacter larvae]|uniref:SseB family protein n=1 Tax=Protaetiibacter larvae TaxID=2592654 RepID=A0A5C1Y7Q9_9MICO|nr:SseB family protein [Protaetiibacter larvae]QEO09881.1 SseB family protein [Protaetiibacter larvae]
MADHRADSAGIPFEGRRFQENPAAADDGSAPERLIEAVRRLQAGELGIAEVVAALHPERLLVPLVAERGDEGVGPHGQTVDKTQELSVVTVKGPDGRAALPAFTSVAAMQRWDPLARPIPIQASRIALAAAAEGTPLVVVDPQSDTQFVVRAPAFRALATGEDWTPSFEDSAVAEAFASSVVGESAVQVIGLAPGDPLARLAGPELVVLLQLDPALPEAARQALLTRLQARWSADELIAARVDSIGVRFTRLTP